MTDLPKPVEPVIPYLTVSNARAAIEFYKQAFGAECTFEMPEEDGDRVMHATLRIGEQAVYLSDAFEDYGNVPAADPEKPTPVSLSLGYEKAEDVDTVFNHAVGLGATVSSPLEDMFWGDRFGHLVDPFGHRWMLRAPLPQS